MGNIDPTEFYCQSNVNNKLSDHGTELNRSHQRTFYIIGLGITLIILIAAILIQQFTV